MPLTLTQEEVSSMEPDRKLPFGETPRPKYETPQDELEQLAPTDPDVRHLEPEAVADKPMGA